MLLVTLKIFNTNAPETWFAEKGSFASITGCTVPGSLNAIVVVVQRKDLIRSFLQKRKVPLSFLERQTFLCWRRGTGQENVGMFLHSCDVYVMRLG